MSEKICLFVEMTCLLWEKTCLEKIDTSEGYVFSGICRDMSRSDMSLVEICLDILSISGHVSEIGSRGYDISPKRHVFTEIFYTFGTNLGTCFFPGHVFMEICPEKDMSNGDMSSEKICLRRHVL